MLGKNTSWFGFGTKYLPTLALVLLSGIAFAQNSQVTVVGRWEGVMFYPAVPAANGAYVECVFSLNGDYTCLASKPGIGMVRHWGEYRIWANQVDLEIKGHQPESVDMAPTDHFEIVSLTRDSMQTRAWVLGTYAYTNFRRSR